MGSQARRVVIVLNTVLEAKKTKSPIKSPANTATKQVMFLYHDPVSCRHRIITALTQGVKTEPKPVLKPILSEEETAANAEVSESCIEFVLSPWLVACLDTVFDSHTGPPRPPVEHNDMPPAPIHIRLYHAWSQETRVAAEAQVCCRSIFRGVGGGGRGEGCCDMGDCERAK